jgi:hypothetical protein
LLALIGMALLLVYGLVEIGSPPSGAFSPTDPSPTIEKTALFADPKGLPTEKATALLLLS